MRTPSPDPAPAAHDGAPGASVRDAVDVVVIGAGQAGLSAAAHLRRIGLVPVDTHRPGDGATGTFVVLDAAPGPGGAWRERWPGLTMRTVHGVHELPGRALPPVDPDEPARDALPRYFADYEAAERLCVRRPVQVRAVRDAEGGALAVETVDRSGRPVGPGPADEGAAPVPADDALGCGAGRRRPVLRAPQDGAEQRDAATAGHGAAPRRVLRTWRARAVVNATGTWTRPFWPVYPGEFAGRQLHTHDFRSAEELAGRDVLVVGGGTSAVQHLLALEGVAASTTWVTRRPPQWRDTAFTPEVGRAAVAEVAARTRAGLPPQSVVAATGLPVTDAYRAGIARGLLRARPVFERLVPDGAVWTPESAGGPLRDGWVTGPEHVRADVVLWATGFRAALDHLRPLGLRQGGGGIVLAGVQAAADLRVLLVGYGPSASTIGANRAGREAARAVRRLLG